MADAVSREILTLLVDGCVRQINNKKQKCVKEYIHPT